MTRFNVRTANLRAINSLTKYPPIPTYHALDPRNGSLSDEVTVFPGDVIATEKVDGTNSRIILLPDGSYLLGSREELLYAEGDLIGNPALGIVEQLRTVAEALPASEEHDLIRVLYLELYGGKVGAGAKHYTRNPARFGWRLFDIALIDNLDERLAWTSEQIAGWRDRGGQVFADEQQLQHAAKLAGLDLTPRLFTDAGSTLPKGIEDTVDVLRFYLPETLAGLDSSGLAEGIVFRAPDRAVIAKARFQDYDRTLKRRRRSV